MRISETVGRFDLLGYFTENDNDSRLEITCESDDFSFSPARVKGKPLPYSVGVVEEQLESLISELQEMLLVVQRIDINTECTS